MRTEEFDFDLPDDLVAQYPAERRDASRLMALDRLTGGVRHLAFSDVVEELQPEDVLVLNETRVVPARLRGHKERTGGRIELLLLRRDDADGTWIAMGRPLRGLQPGDWIRLNRGTWRLEVVGREGDRVRLKLPVDTPVDPSDPTGFQALLPMSSEAGDIPLPPYIQRPPEASDADRYQTVFARDPGSIAAPTAGLHFTESLLDAVRDRGVAIERVVLHVGPGTFEPIRSEDPRQHRLEAEYYRVSESTAACINERRRAGGRCIAVGTTTVRTLETCASPSSSAGVLRAGEGWTDLLIYPSHTFNAVDGMVTNFHLPRASLLLLVSALAGQQKLLDAYQLAIANRYRFYSYGDAMLIQ
jgi:S-adenosylmethionine:tRNA ribosyltransferase-isomerase